MNITSVFSEKAAKQVHKTVKDMGGKLNSAHFQAIENRLESPEGDHIYIQRILDDTGEDGQKLISPSTSEGQIFGNQYQLCKQNMLKTTRSNRFIYCIASHNTDGDVKTVCVVLLSQSQMQSESGMCPDYEYEALLYYVNIPLRRSEGQLKQSLDIRDVILQAITGQDEFQKCVKVDLFSTGRLWEMPIQLPGYDTMYLSMHEPIERPSILNIVLQKYSGMNVSVELCTDLILN
jgi:hypothetical protein